MSDSGVKSLAPRVALLRGGGRGGAYGRPLGHRAYPKGLWDFPSVPFLVATTKYLTTSSQSRKGLFGVKQSTVAGTAEQQEQEVAGNVTSAVRKQRERRWACWLAFSQPVRCHLVETSLQMILWRYISSAVPNLVIHNTNHFRRPSLPCCMFLSREVSSFHWPCIATMTHGFATLPKPWHQTILN